MKKILSWAISAAVVLWISGFTAGAAPLGRGVQGHSGGHAQGKATHGKRAQSKEGASAEKGKKPEEKGLEHAEQVANPEGVTHGIENAETKQREHRLKGESGSAKGHKGKHLAKGRGKGKALAKGRDKDKGPE